MATVLNLFVDQGSFYSKYITVLAPAGTVYDLTDYTVSSQMRKSSESSISYDIPCTIVNPSQGKIKLRFGAATTESIPPGRYLYDVEVTDSAGEKLRVLEGVVVITPQMTRT